MLKTIPKDQLTDYVGKELGISDWFLVDQDRVNRFADVTLDHQFIHVDPERAAKETMLGGTIAHGFLTLSLLPHLIENLIIVPEGMTWGMNYGFEKIRFLAPLRVGSEIRARLTLRNLTERNRGQYQFTFDVSVEVKGSDKPILVAEWLSLIFAE
ncbi:MaoC family dehydratase [Alphaproteobacteria bacterium LMG 31809]|uniref:MaoC family dehydratase n=1 Tax=Govanella unica TaxID=2975056 RepID=A0A9X3Z768_9PROT|nr:MaoC family dehydratase [Govania unica]MDA5193846.1 MaoC family dehydratase [Govania unica]